MAKGSMPAFTPRNPGAVKMGDFSFDPATNRVPASAVSGGVTMFAGGGQDVLLERERAYAQAKETGQLHTTSAREVFTQPTEKERMFDQLLDKLGPDQVAALMSGKTAEIVPIKADAIPDLTDDEAFEQALTTNRQMIGDVPHTQPAGAPKLKLSLGG